MPCSTVLFVSAATASAAPVFATYDHPTQDPITTAARAINIGHPRRDCGGAKTLSCVNICETPNIRRDARRMLQT
jgi:hypothetical protein